MLKAKKFGNRDKAIEKKVIPAIKSQIQKQGGYIKEDVFLRIREEQNSYDITLKCRHPDRYISASYDLTHPADHSGLRFKGFKFEEDITTPFHSKFSSQAKFEDHKKPELKIFQDILSIYILT
jgi:hypothetical protein